ncbi:MAG: glycosyl transferase family 1, partial [Dehalococcoidia bacterium]|nr:glycosyl transferase family 1 [Dehalococcoidia bacterium]
MDGKSLRVLRVGLFDRNYPRNRTTAAALRAAGAEITDLHAPVLESIRDRLRPARATRALAQLGQRIVAGEAGLVVRAAPALAKTDIVLIGYPGQWDAVFWSPLARRAGCTVVFDPLVTLTETFVEDRALLAPGSWQAR